MTSWDELVAVEPDFSERVKRLFDAGRHKTMATLRRDGSPRISGTEVEFADGEMWVGMMPGSLKALDLRRDPRLAIHCPTDDPPEDASAWPGDAKVAGRAVEQLDPPPSDGSHRFRIDLEEVVLTKVGTPADHLVVESWHPGRGLERRTRR